MSVEAKPAETGPITEKALPPQPEASSAPAETAAATTTEAPVATEAAAPTTEETAAVPATEEVKKDEPAETVPATEGVLGYKAPGFFKQLLSSKQHFFWFSEEPLTTESLSTFLKAEKVHNKHGSAAWAQETGKGLLFHSKRAEDKSTPAGIINLADASDVVKDGFSHLSFKVADHTHKLEAATAKERDSWIVAIENAIKEAKELKDDILGRESYKKNVEEHAKAPTPVAAAVKTARSKSKDAKKSLDATTATVATSSAPVATADSSSSTTDAKEEPKTGTKKERSQSRKRTSIFGSLLSSKKDEVEQKKEEVKPEADDKKVEPKADEEAVKPAETVEAPTEGVAPVADKKDEETPAVATSATEKKGKRSSVFGSLFKKSGVTSPTTEKSEKEATTTDVPPVSETAPKIDEPIENKPIDTAAVTAPVDTPSAPVVAEEAPKDPAPAPVAAEPSSPPKEKKGGLLGLLKKGEAKKDTKEETKEEDKVTEPVAAVAPTEPATETAATTDATPETPAKEERPEGREKRRPSLFGLSSKKTTKDTEADDSVGEPTKREKSPLPGKITGLLRRASKAVRSDKSESPKKETAEPVAAETPAAETTETPAAAATTTTTTDAPETKIVGDVVPESLQAKPAEPAPVAAPEVKATA